MRPYANMKARRANAGFTLVELVFSVLILGILTAMAVPSFSGLRDRMAVRSTINAFQGALSETRFSAMRTGSPATFSAPDLMSEQTDHAKMLPSPDLGAASNTPGSVSIEPRLAMLSNPLDTGSVTIGAGGYRARFSISPAGHASVCTPEGAQSPGYSPC